VKTVQGFLRFTVFTVSVAAVFLIAGCRAQTKSFTADVTTDRAFAGLPPMSGKLYLTGNHIRVDWGLFADVFDLTERKGWRILSDSKAYQELGSKDLSTYAPEMTNGSLCPHAQVPSQCKLLGTEVVEGRAAKKWDVYNPNGFHVYFWTDEKLGVTLRMAMGDTTAYQLANFHQNSVSESMFQLPTGYQKVERPFKP
jgi:hypothetical protein